MLRDAAGKFHLPFDADLAGTNVLLIEVGHIEIGRVSWQIGDEDHFVSVLVCGSSERLVVFHFLFWFAFLSFVILVLFLIADSKFAAFKSQVSPNNLNFPKY